MRAIDKLCETGFESATRNGEPKGTRTCIIAVNVFAHFGALWLPVPQKCGKALGCG